MKNAEIKKVQFGGWGKRPYSEIRKKIEVMSLEEREPRFSLKKKKKCKFNKGVHVWEKHEHDFLRRIYCKYVCVNCGKQDWREKNIKDGVIGVVVAQFPVKEAE